ncbi:hypothetical protein DF3PB_1140001 [uncultured Defluviicoccus sp.]|uniref:Uncharacterized protein n=1 Tax=metagenome TaxID=256318 RepID=A0A380T8U0_9ZZZZ|nr:hypothetical protein DF3PB_1140001 [uncultured Defluviicoccus sp.]
MIILVSFAVSLVPRVNLLNYMYIASQGQNDYLFAFCNIIFF